MRNFNVMPGTHSSRQVLDGTYDRPRFPGHLLTVHPRGASLDQLHAVDGPDANAKHEFKMALARGGRPALRRAGRP